MTDIRTCQFCGGKTKIAISKEGDVWAIICQNDDCSAMRTLTLPKNQREAMKEAVNRMLEEVGGVEEEE